MDTLLPFEKLKPTILIRKIAQTSPKYGKDPLTRSVEEHIKYGVVNIDKPQGPTSHQVSAYVQKILGINKSGHSGTLDPNVTGVLPCTLLKSTKIVQTLLKAGKEYVCLMHLHKPVDEYKIFEVLGNFTGKIKQMPPIKSSVKRQWRDRTIYYIEVLEISGQEVLFKVGCEAGTYIRKLCHDIGQSIGVGAHMAELRRSKAGPFNESKIFTLHDLTDAYYYYKEENNETFIRQVIQTVEEAVSHLPKIWVTDMTVSAICHGASLAVPGISKLHNHIEPDQLVAIFTLKDELVSFGRALMNSKKMMGKKGLAVKTDKVIMDIDVYPKMN
jgi:H/ACA ribonucleoprotein complex subunit 4